MKKVVVRLMSAAGIGKQHVEFKEFFNHVYRGTAFALVSLIDIATSLASHFGIEVENEDG